MRKLPGIGTHKRQVPSFIPDGQLLRNLLAASRVFYLDSSCCIFMHMFVLLYTERSCA